MLQIAGPPAPETLRRDQLERRQRIVRAALRALASGDYDQVKVSEVARDSGVALGTVYRYFSSKEHLFAAAFVEWQGALKKKLRNQAPRGDTEAERVRDIFHRAIRAFQLQPQFYRVVMVLASTTDSYATDVASTIAEQFREIMQTAFDGPDGAHGADGPDLADREAILRTLTAVLDQSLRSWVMSRSAIGDVYACVDDAIRLIYEYPPRR